MIFKCWFVLVGSLVIVVIGGWLLWLMFEFKLVEFKFVCIVCFEVVVVLGQLEFVGDICNLVVFNVGMVGIFWVVVFNVNEGDLIKIGQVLVFFDYWDGFFVDLECVDVQLSSFDQEIQFQVFEVECFSKVVDWGVVELILVDNKCEELVCFQGKWDQVLVECKGFWVDFVFSQLILFFDGVVFKLYVCVGECFGVEGVMDVGVNYVMQVSIEVYEFDIFLICFDQFVCFISENGGFCGEFVGCVLCISLQVE